nr:double-stranded RNA-binding protein Staufen homolog 2-like [Oncorhynchus nerka]
MEASRKQGAPVNYLTPKLSDPLVVPLSPGHTPYYSPPAVATAAMARELLMNGSGEGRSGENIGLKGKSSVQPSQQLEYLAQIQGFQVGMQYDTL